MHKLFMNGILCCIIGHYLKSKAMQYVIEMLYIYSFENSKKFVGVLLMADVSGFTALSERYHNTGKGGAYRLTVTLNTYLGSLIELIYCHGGDVIKFAGDAFLALWKIDKKTYLCHTIHTVIACCLIIQHSYASYETDVKVSLKVKLAISAGNLTFAPIGTGNDKNFVLTGLPVFEAKDAESVCSSGEVKLSATAWGHCYSRNYDHIVHEDGHVTIKAILYDPRDANVSKPFAGLGSLIRHQKKQYSAIEHLPNELWDETITPNVVNTLRNNETLTLRETMLIGIEKNIGGDIRKFMIPPVVQQIDAHQPLEYLTEMRHVTVMFITLKPYRGSVKQLITIVNKAYEITCDMVYKNMGCINKIILFDKDVMILVIFGLRGFKHESEAQAALKSAYGIKKSLSLLDGVIQVSVGVTSGQVYCGVVGHPLRREFTVIGAIVNKAARLMCYFRDKITCDEDTYIKSKMSANSFTLQPYIPLKGIANAGKIYEYTEELRVKEIKDIPIVAPLLDRYKEMEYFGKWIGNSRKSRREYDGILLVGDNRIGKSRILEWMSRDGRNRGFEICHVSLTSIHSATPHLAINQITDRLLKITEPIKSFEKEEKIVHTLQIYDDDLCYLNNIIKTRFAYHEGIYSQNDTIRHEKTQNIFKKLVMSVPDYFLICIDDLHNLDHLSWDFISMILSVHTVFIVLTITKEKINPSQKWLYNVFKNTRIKKLNIGQLSSDLMGPLACQILDVEGVPKELCLSLQTKCKCMPGVIESYLVHLFSTGALDIKKMGDESEIFDLSEYELPDSSLLRPIALNQKDQITLDEIMKDEETEEIKLCVVLKKEELDTNINVQNTDAQVIMQIDSLTPYQQLLLKIASVIGSVISRDLLENIMYDNNCIMTAKAIKRLFSMKLLSCANRSRWRRVTIVNNSSNTSLSGGCDCVFNYDEDDSYGLPKYAFCKLMRFKNKRSRQTCYELLPLNQKKEFHSRIVNYLEHYEPKCNNCGGTTLIVQSFSDHVVRKSRPNIELDESDDDYKNRHRSTEFLLNNHILNQPQSTLTLNERLQHRSSSATENLKLVTLSEKAKLSDNSYSFSHHPSILKPREDPSSVAMHRRSTKRVTMPSILFKKLSFTELQEDRIFTKIRTIAEADDIKDWEELGFYDEIDVKSQKKVSNKKSYWINLEKGVSQTNFKKCTCAQLRILTYEQLIHHATQADLKIKTIEFLINYCKYTIDHTLVKSVFERLTEAEAKCNELFSNALSLEKISKHERTLFLGHIYTLRSAANTLSGNFVAAKLDLEYALRLYKINFFTVSKVVKMWNFLGRRNKRKYRGNDALLYKDCLTCLNIATIIYNNVGDDKRARYTAAKALKVLSRVDYTVVQVCDTFSNAMNLELDRGCLDGMEELENGARESLRNLSKPIQSHEVFEIGKLFLTSFHARVSRALLSSAIRSGFRSLVLSRFVFADNVSLEIIPDLFYVLLARRRVEDSVDLLSELLHMCDKKRKLDFEIWYYALCMDMILDAGFQLEYPENILRFGDYTIHNSNLEPNSGSWRRLSVGLWTYCLRCDLDRKAKRWENEAMKWTNRKGTNDTMSELISALRLAEGMLESLSKKVDDLRKVSYAYSKLTTDVLVPNSIM